MSKSLTSQQLAELSDCTLVGDPSVLIQDVSDIDSAQPHHATFLANPLYTKSLSATQAGVIFVDAKTELPAGKTFLVGKNPSVAFQKAIVHFKGGIPKTGFKGVHPSAIIHPTAKIAADVEIGPLVVVDEHVEIGAGTSIGAGCVVGPYTKIGSHCTLYPRVVIRENCTIGNQVILQPGAVIGACGFGFTLNERGEHEKLEQLGTVVVEDNVEIGANTTIDRARFSATRIGKGTKIDNLVQIAHAVELGQHNIIVAQTGIAGSTQTGNYVIIGGQCAIAGHLKLANGVRIAACSGVSKDLKTGTYNGIPAIPIEEYNKNTVYLRNIEKLNARVKSLESRSQAST